MTNQSATTLKEKTHNHNNMITEQKQSDLFTLLERQKRFKELVMVTKAIIRKKYLDPTDTKDWAVAFSGGKDSTTVVALLVNAIESLPMDQRKRHVHIVMSNTQTENPLVDEHMEAQEKLITKYIKEKQLPMNFKVVQRPVQDSYYYLTLGKGYPLPQSNGSGRWCTFKLKIQPQDRYLDQLDISYVLTGVRLAESASRAKSIEKWQIDEFIGGHVSLKNVQTFNPLIHWTIEDVWRYLQIEGLSWGSTLSVRTIYKDATGECGFSNPMGVEQKVVEVCGARHGCWNCPVVLKDKSTEKMSEKHTWMEPLTEWRMLQLKVYGVYHQNRKAWKEKNKRIKNVTKSGYRRNGTKMKDGQGCLTIPARKYLFEELLYTEKLVNRLREMNGLEPISLISEEEKEMIQRQWEIDTEEIPNVCNNKLGLQFESILSDIEE